MRVNHQGEAGAVMSRRISRGSDPAADPAIAIESLRVVRGGRVILRDISMAVPVGSIYGLVGPSGSGKTTLIRSIVGLQRITAGAITVLGTPAGSASLRRVIGYMPQLTAVYDDLTARENLRFFAGIADVPKSRVEDVLDLVDLTPEADRPIVNLSGGQRQRVSLAVALLPSPRLLLLDEPTVGLDPRLRHRLWRQFREWADAGATLLISTHVMDEAAHVDRLAFMADGALVSEGRPRDLLARTGAASLEDAVLRLIESSEGEGSQ